MGANQQGFPQGSIPPTQPAQPPTQYGNIPTNPYAPPPPYTSPPNKPNRRWMYLLFGLILIIVILIGSVVVLLSRQGSPTSTSTATASPTTAVQPTTAPTQPLLQSTPIVTQPPVDPTKQGKAISSSQTDPPYTTPNGTVICSGDVSVTEPNGTAHHPDSDPTTGEVVAAIGSGYTITFTNSASCIQYPPLTRGQVNGILSGLEAQQKSSGCVNNAGCTGSEQVWIFPQ